MVTVGLSFNGIATMNGFSCDLAWTVTSVDGNNFTLNQILSQNGNQLENSNGQGTFSQSNDIIMFQFEDAETTFEGNYDLSTGKFIGTASQKDGSGNGSFDLNRQ